MLVPRNLVATATVGLICALAVASAHGQAAPETKPATDVATPGKGKEGIVKLADSSIEYFSRGEGQAARATLVNVPGAAHLLPLEQPETAAAHMISFIRQLDRKPSRNRSPATGVKPCPKA